MAEIQKDIMLDDDNDLLILDGDFVIDESFEQDIRLILGLVSKGDLKSDPILSPELIRLINSKEGDSTIIQKVRLNLERDNKQVGNITFENGILNIEPKK